MHHFQKKNKYLSKYKNWDTSYWKVEIPQWNIPSIWFISIVTKQPLVEISPLGICKVFSNLNKYLTNLMKIVFETWFPLSFLIRYSWLILKNVSIKIFSHIYKPHRLYVCNKPFTKYYFSSSLGFDSVQTRIINLSGTAWRHFVRSKESSLIQTVFF